MLTIYKKKIILIKYSMVSVNMLILIKLWEAFILHEGV